MLLLATLMCVGRRGRPLELPAPRKLFNTAPPAEHGSSRDPDPEQLHKREHAMAAVLALVELLAAAYAPAAAVGRSSALAISLQQLDRAAAAHRARPAVASPISSPAAVARAPPQSPVFDACLGVCRSLDARATAESLAAAGKVPGVAATLRWRQSLLERHFVDEPLVGGVLLEALAHVPAGQAELLEVADAVAASARFILLQPEERP